MDDLPHGVINHLIALDGLLMKGIGNMRILIHAGKNGKDKFDIVLNGSEKFFPSRLINERPVIGEIGIIPIPYAPKFAPVTAKAHPFVNGTKDIDRIGDEMKDRLQTRRHIRAHEIGLKTDITPKTFSRK